MFRKPKDPTVPTTALYLANCSVSDVQSKDTLLEVLEAFGEIIQFICQEDKGFAVVEFASTAEARAAKKALSDPENDQAQLLHKNGNKRRIFLQYAECQVEDCLPPPPTYESIPCTSTTENVIVPGLSMIQEFITEEQEQELLKAIDERPWIETISRHVQHYGYEFRYDTRDVDIENPLGHLPGFTHEIVENFASYRPDLLRPDQLTINQYLPGQGIAAHVDTKHVFTRYITSLSLASDIVMQFRDTTSNQYKNVVLPRRSLCIMTGDSRYLWTHGIAYRKIDHIQGNFCRRERRVSLTFRKVVGVNGGVDASSHNKHTLPTSLEKKNVHQVYDTIATHFSYTRHYPWPLVETYFSTLPKYSMIADIGCGNGKYLVLPKTDEYFIVGSDRCLRLLEHCRLKSQQVFASDALTLPLRTASFDSAICVAVLHHMETIEHRLQVLRELARIVRIGGSILLVAWAFEGNSKAKLNQQDILIEWKLQEKHKPAEAKQREDDGGIYDPKKQWTVYKRYCHLYQQEEICRLVNQIPGLRVQNASLDHANWYLTIERTSQ